MSAPNPPREPEAPAATARKRSRAPLVLLLIAALIVVGGAAYAYHVITAPTLTGTWYGQGTFGFSSAGGASSISFALYLDLTQIDSTHVKGTGQVCVPALSVLPSAFTVEGTTSSDLHKVNMTVGGSNEANAIDANLNNGTLNITFPSSNNTFTGKAALAKGTEAQFKTLCTSLPTPAPTAG